LGCLSQALFSEAARSNSLKNTVWTHSWAAATEDLSDRGGFLVQFACHIQIIPTGNQAIFDADEILAKDRVEKKASMLLLSGRFPLAYL
jgi:hypothetical protein